MVIYINDKTNSAKPLYYQSLVLLFLPCEKFGTEDNENSLYIDAYCEGNENVANVRLIIGDREAVYSCREIIDTAKYAQMKNLIGRTILKAAHKLFGIVPPWGISTGVKPVKLARMFVATLGAEAAFKVLTEDYMITPVKAKMAISACEFEDKAMSAMCDNPCSLYVSIPFCPTKCNYCSFVSCTTPRLLSMIPDYINFLNKELVVISETVKDLGFNLKSIYVGGGTPAILTESQIFSVINTIANNYDIAGCEFTFEAGRPDCITYDKLKVLSDFGVGRISVNTQTTNDDVLKSVGRNHTFGDYLKAMEMAKTIGFKCVNTDLIAGLPGESSTSFLKSLKDVVSLAPENITVHAFTLKKSSNYRISGEKNFDAKENEAVYMTDSANEYLYSSGYTPYYVYRQKNTVGNLENVGYSKPGFESIYNIIMMGEYHTVFGAGAGSVTKLVTDNGNRVDRIFSPKYPYEFLNKDKYSGFDKEGVIKILKER